MIELLPPYLREYREMSQIMKAEEREIETINNTHNQLVDNRYIQTCDEVGIKRFESILKITPLQNDSLDDRKYRCIAIWNQKLPYNYYFLDSKLKSLCGDGGYQLLSDFGTRTIIVKLALTEKNQYDTVKNVLYEIIPCNMVVKVQLMYNQHGLLKKYTHEELSQHTHLQLRENVL